MLESPGKVLASCSRGGFFGVREMDQTGQYTLHNWIIVCSGAYMEYTFVPWLGRHVYRRTVDYQEICMQ